MMQINGSVTLINQWRVERTSCVRFPNRLN
jgi:hypothetical protein